MAFAGAAKNPVGIAGKVVLANFGFPADGTGFAFGFRVRASTQGAVDEGFNGGWIAEDTAEFIGGLEALAWIFGK